jgi:hypothetical protein
VSQFTGGSVRYLKRLKTADYEHHEAEATISWSAAEDGEDAARGRAETEATSQVLRMLGLQPVVNGQPMSVKELQNAGLSITEVETPTATIFVNGAAPLEIGHPTMGIPTQMRKARKSGKPATQEVSDPLAMGPGAPAPEPASAGPAAPASAADPLAMGASVSATPVSADTSVPGADPWAGIAEPSVVYTDADLQKACGEANIRLSNAGDPAASLTVRALVGKFAGEGRGPAMIDQAKRKDFLAALAILEPHK